MPDNDIDRGYAEIRACASRAHAAEALPPPYALLSHQYITPIPSRHIHHPHGKPDVPDAHIHQPSHQTLLHSLC